LAIDACTLLPAKRERVLAGLVSEAAAISGMSATAVLRLSSAIPAACSLLG
jgi:hypothetical protein